MSVYEMAKKYYPRLWDKSRIEALVRAGKLSREEANEIMGDDGAGGGPRAEQRQGNKDM